MTASRKKKSIRDACDGLFWDLIETKEDEELLKDFLGSEVGEELCGNALKDEEGEELCGGTLKDEGNSPKPVIMPIDFPEGNQDGREFALISFGVRVGDSQDPAKSELMRKMIEHGFEPLGRSDLLALSKYHPDLHFTYRVVARAEPRRGKKGDVCWVLESDFNRFGLCIRYLKKGWDSDCWFFVYRKVN